MSNACQVIKKRMSTTFENLQEAIELTELFPSIPQPHVLTTLMKYNDFDPPERLKCTIRELLMSQKYPTEVFNRDFRYIKQLFPDLDDNYIKDKLCYMGFVNNRVEIVIRNLLNQEQEKPLMRCKEPTERKRDVGEDVNTNAVSDGGEGPSIKKMCVIAGNDVNGNVDLNLPSTSGNVNGWDSVKKEPEMNCEAECVGETEKPKRRKSVTFTLPPIKPQKYDVIKVDSDEDESIVDEQPKKEKDKDEHVDKRLLYHVMEMFPLADTNFLREVVRHRKFNEEQITVVIDTIFNTPNYPKRDTKSPERRDTDQIVKEEKLATLQELLPDADPRFLEESLQDITTEQQFQEFVSQCLQDRHYPTYKEFIKDTQLSAQVKQYTTEFSVTKFLELHPDPVNFFESDKCKAMRLKTDENYRYADMFFRNLFPNISVNQIYTSLRRKHLLLALNDLKNTKKGFLRKNRKVQYQMQGTKDIPLLQALAYIKHKDAIIQHLEEQKKAVERERAEAKAHGLLKTCNCCFDDEVMLNDIVTCNVGCEFCRSCLENSVSILFSEGKLDFPCLASCGSQFDIPTLQKSLKPKLFSKLVQKKQLEEIKAAGIEDIEFCPFCDFATIMTPENKLFVCLNPDCMKESCRLCKEPSHIPLRCEEVEKDDDTKRRTYIENKMTEALIRKCHKCGMTFIKADGCNKMTCSCGAMMCYVCNQPVQDYKHFNGQGGTNFELCPLYSDTNKLHRDAVLKSAAEAKKQLGTEELKVDPTVGIKEYYAVEMKKNPNRVPGY